MTPAHPRLRAQAFKISVIRAKSSRGLPEAGEHTVAVYHLRAGIGGAGDLRALTSFRKIRQRAVKDLVRRIEEVNIAHAGEIAPGAGAHVIRDLFLPVAHEPFHRLQKGIADGHIPAVQRLHPRFFGVVPGHLAGRDGDDVPRLRQGSAQGIVVGRDAQRQRAAGGKAAGADISAAVKPDHSAVARIDHVVGLRDAVLRTQRIKGEPHIAAGLPHQLAHHGQVAPVGPDDHSAAEKVEDRAL